MYEADPSVSMVSAPEFKETVSPM